MNYTKGEQFLLDENIEDIVMGLDSDVVSLWKL